MGRSNDGFLTIVRRGMRPRGDDNKEEKREKKCQWQVLRGTMSRCHCGIKEFLSKKGERK